MTENAITIPLSKRKILLLALGAAAFVAVGVWLYLIADHLPHRSPLFVKLMAGVCVIFFGLCGVYGARKLFDAAPGLVIDAQGILDNSSAVSAGLIPWSEVTGIKVTTLNAQRFLTIEVRDPENYIQRASGLKRLFVALNAKHFGGPIQITSNTLEMPFDDLVKNITEAHVRYGGT
jgi:hypothetical protein